MNHFALAIVPRGERDKKNGLRSKRTSFRYFARLQVAWQSIQNFSMILEGASIVLVHMIAINLNIFKILMKIFKTTLSFESRIL